MVLRSEVALWLLVGLLGVAVHNVLTGGWLRGMRGPVAIWSIPATVLLLGAVVGVAGGGGGGGGWGWRWGVSCSITAAWVVGMALAVRPPRWAWPFVNLVGPILIVCLAGRSDVRAVRGAGGVD